MLARLLASAVVAFALGACPIAPNFASDAGPDSGVDAGQGNSSDGGDGGHGSVAAQFLPSNGSSEALAWNGADLANTTVDSTSETGAEQVTLYARNDTAGVFKLTLSNLTAGSTASQFVAVSYQPASGPDLWSCDTVGNTNCTPIIQVNSFDGTTLAGLFSVSFPVDGSLNSAQLSSGNFTVVLP